MHESMLQASRKSAIKKTKEARCKARTSVLYSRVSIWLLQAPRIAGAVVVAKT
jgi:hypothetical protein